MKRSLILALALSLLIGCDSYEVEMNPEWKEDASNTSVEAPSPQDPSVEEPETEDPTDTDPPWIELSEDDDATDPDDTEPDETDPIITGDCEGIVCSELGPFCYDTLAIECCPACDAGSRTCGTDSPANYYQEQYLCAGGCWEIESTCEYGSYCKEDVPGEPVCEPLPTTYDGFCDPEFEWVDPDCQTCSVCEFPNESYCDRTGVSPDAIIQCIDFTGYGHYCWSYELCSTTGFDNFCVEDFAQNLAACTGFDNQEEVCSQFVCTGVQTCNADGTTSEDCGYCNTCCDINYGPLCGHSGTDQSSSSLLIPNEDGNCFDAEVCEQEPGSDSASSYCRISEVDFSATCEPANFFGN